MKNALPLKILPALLSAVFALPGLAQPFTKPGIYLEPGPDIITGAQQVDVSLSREECRVQLRPKSDLKAQRSHGSNNQPPAYIAQASHELSCIGVAWVITQPHQVIYVDPQSDLYGKVVPGDLIISQDGIDPTVCRTQRRNFGTENTLITVVFQRGKECFSYQCHRHPVAWFSPYFRSTLNL